MEAESYMAKINRTIVTIKSVLENNGVKQAEGKRTTKRITRKLLSLFSLVDDPRIKGMVDYPLEYILLIAFLSVLGCANTWQEMEDFGKSKSAWLGKFMDVKKYGIPSHDTFRRVFGIIETRQLQGIVVDTLLANLDAIRQNLHIDSSDKDGFRLLCIDGKEENGTGRRYCAKQNGKVRNTQTLHVYDATNMVCVASEPIDKKTNEIPAAQNILETLNLGRTICTFDALHMQRETVRITRSQGGHYVGGLKGNQQGLMDEAASCFTDDLCAKLRKSRKKKKPVYLKFSEHAHSQEETREYFLTTPPDNAERDKKWIGLSSYILCIKTTVPNDPALDKSIEFRYYASDMDDLSVISDAIRAHWSVEQFHWQLDHSFKEDDNSTMDTVAFENLSLMIKMSLHVIQLMKTTNKNVSVRRFRKRFAWNFEENLEQMLLMFHDEAIVQVLNEKAKTVDN